MIHKYNQLEGLLFRVDFNKIRHKMICFIAFIFTYHNFSNHIKYKYTPCKKKKKKKIRY